jgi:hypothetical protein
LRVAISLGELLALTGRAGEAQRAIEEAMRPFGNEPVSGDRARARELLARLRNES